MTGVQTCALPISQEQLIRGDEFFQIMYKRQEKEMLADDSYYILLLGSMNAIQLVTETLVDLFADTHSACNKFVTNKPGNLQEMTSSIDFPGLNFRCINDSNLE